MEKAVGIPTTLFGGPPELGNVTKLANSQIGFMNIFAGPLFEAVTDILPAMGFAVAEMKKNQDLWRQKIEKEKADDALKVPISKLASEGHPSPRSGSPNRLLPVQPDLSHSEGLPASLSSNRIPTISAISQSFGTSQQTRRGSAGSFGHLFGTHEPGSASSSPDVSRRSSLGFPFGYNSPPHDSTSFSRRSSGAFPGANIQNSNLSTRRSSNTMPSQLHIESASDSISQFSMPVAGVENHQPQQRRSEETRLPAASGATLYNNADRNQKAYNALTLDGASDMDGHRGHQRGSAENSSLQRYSPSQHSSSLDNTQATRHGSNSTSGPLSATSSHNRSSSGAHTSATQSMPYSPTGTLATSFLTVDSDDKSFRAGAESWTGPTSRSYPMTIEADSLESERGSTAPYQQNLSNEDIIKVSAANGSSSAHEHLHAHGRDQSHTQDQRVVTRKGSRFRLGFWRKKGKATETGP